jgi:hypothetical protein
MGGKCPIAMCSTLKQEENVPQSYVTFFRNRMKMSTNHVDTFMKWEENIP